MIIHRITWDRLILIDKVIGRSAMLFAAKCRINKIFTPVMSLEALEVTKLYNIGCTATNTVPYIINRDKTGKCPIESSVSQTIDLEEALINIKRTAAELANRNNSLQ
jgi:Zn-dependent alcohol dehydrogenase